MRGDDVANYKRRRDENPIHTLGDYSKPSHKGYRNTIELPERNNVVPLRSETIRLVQKGCSFHGLRSEDLNQHLKDFLKLMDSLDLNGDNRERMRLCLFQFSLCDQASNWLELLPAGSISTWEDLTTRFLAYFFPLGRTAKLQNDILMFQQHQGESLSEVWTLVPTTLSTAWKIPIKLLSNMRPRVLTKREASDARLSKFEADFKQQQSETTNKIDTVLKAIIDRITGALPSNTIKNPKLNVNHTTPVLSTRSYPTGDSQCSSHPPNSINAVKTCSNETNHSQMDQLQTVTEIRTRQTKEPEQTLEDEFRDLHLNLPVLDVLAHALMYNAILDKYMESLELGTNGSAFIKGEMPKRMEDPELFTIPCRLEDSKPFDTLADLGSCVNIILLYLFKKLNIGLLEETIHVFGLADGTKSYLVGIIRDVEVHIGRLKLLNDFYVIDMKKDPETPLLVGREFLATRNAVIDYRKAKIAVGEGITRSIFEYFLQETTNKIACRKFFLKKNVKFSQYVETALENIVTPSGLSSDRIKIFPDGVKPSDM
ncbi:MAK10-like protein [Tanacetum coccineum]